MPDRSRAAALACRRIVSCAILAALGLLACRGRTEPPPSPGEVLAAKNALLGRQVFENETNAGLAAVVGTAVVTGGPTPEKWRDLLGAVTDQVTPAGNLTDSGTISFTDV